MIFVCINKGKILNLTEGKKYIGEKTKRHLKCLDDNNRAKMFSIKRFISLENWRHKQINKIINEKN